MSNTIVLTTDLSETARRAYGHAIRLAQAYDLPIRLVHVVDRVMQYNAADFGDSEEWLDLLTKEREKAVREESKRLLSEGVQVIPSTILGRAVPDILAYARTARIVVIASHGRGGFRRFFLGSVASRVIQKSPAPVLVIGKDTADKPFSNALFGTDLSDAAEDALPLACRLLEPLNVPVELFHADVNPSLITELRGERYEVPGVKSRKEYEEVVDERLQSMANVLRQAGVQTVAHQAMSTRAAEAIVARADQRDDDLIVLASHGRGRASVMTIGSTCDEVLRRSDRAVLVIRPEVEPLEA